MSEQNSNKLSLFDSVGMAIGGMVGGGIFAVLGTAVSMGGNAAFISFFIAGILALITGISYSRLTISFDQPGGGFLFIEKISGKNLAGSVSWFLILGYIFTISLYAYTFGAYFATLLNLDKSIGGFIGIGIIIFLSSLNIIGVRESGIAEDILVYSKILLLIIAIIAGFFITKRSESLPIIENSWIGVFAASSIVFVAYEGFQLLTYDYKDIKDHKENLSRAILVSIPVVIVLYMLIAFVTTATLSDQEIKKHTETVLAYVVEPVLGRAGFTAVVIAALFSTASAINATIFATARLAKRIGVDNQLPQKLVNEKSGGVPIFFVIMVALIASGIQFFGNLHQITSFSSLVFLLVFGIVNLFAILHREYKGFAKVFPGAAILGCIGAAITILINQYKREPNILLVFLGIAILLVISRIIFFRFHTEKKE